MVTLIYLTGIAVFTLVIYLTLELAPAIPTGRLAETLTPSDGFDRSGWRKTLSTLDQPVAKWAPAGFLRRTRSDLYWAQLGEQWADWNEVQFTSLRLALAAMGSSLGVLATGEPVLGLVGGLIGFQYPSMNMAGKARRIRRQFIAQLPEFIQLVSAQMSAGVSMDEAISRVSKSPGMVSGWMREVIRQAQGRDLFEQIQREAQESLLPELIGMSIQLTFIRRGTAQKELMGQLAMSIAADYIGGAEQRAEKLGSEMIVPMVLFYFVPFLAVILTVLLYPVLVNLFGGL